MYIFTLILSQNKIFFANNLYKLTKNIFCAKLKSTGGRENVRCYNYWKCYNGCIR